MQPKIEIPIEYWDMENGAIGARLETSPTGEIWAKNLFTLDKGIKWLLDRFTLAERERKQNNSEIGMLGGDIEGMWIEGDFVVRFLPVPGFGVSFPDEQSCKDWMSAWLKIVAEAEKQSA